MGGCPDCGARVAGGREACQALFDQFSAQAYRDLGWARWHNLAFDAYCLQHPGRYCRSAKSYAAHLTRLCCGLEHEGSPRVYQAIQRWLSRKRELERPHEPARRGRRTVVDLFPLADSQESEERVKAWAREVWEAYRSQQGLAQAWLRAALDSSKNE